jgi:hypothetical protein
VGNLFTARAPARRAGTARRAHGSRRRHCWPDMTGGIADQRTQGERKEDRWAATRCGRLCLRELSEVAAPINLPVGRRTAGTSDAEMPCESQPKPPPSQHSPAKPAPAQPHSFDTTLPPATTTHCGHTIPDNRPQFMRHEGRESP